jgi:hypothetical protein
VCAAQRSAVGVVCAAGDNKSRAAKEAAAQQRTFRALDSAMRVINQMLSMGDMFGGVGGVRRANAAMPAALAAGTAAPPAVRPAGPSKRVSFRARARAKRDVLQARTLGATHAPLHAAHPRIAAAPFLTPPPVTSHQTQHTHNTHNAGTLRPAAGHVPVPSS